ncbi:MAG TPA: TlpA disulfide reductase family protein [Pirellulales bacterium]|nr:TlpA disulfide reductase family protein [Pirellulales bacterium]
MTIGYRSLTLLLALVLVLDFRVGLAQRPRADGSKRGGAKRVASAGLPRYWFKVGQELNYETAKEFTTSDGRKITSQADWQLWVVDENDDGSWQIVLRHALGSSTVVDENAPKPKPSAQDDEAAATAVAERVTLARFEVFPDGRVAENPALAFRVEPELLFLQLPKTRQEFDEGWEAINPTTQVHYRYRLVPQDDKESDLLVATATRESVIDEIFASTSKSTFYFNRERGIVERVETQDSQSFLVVGKGSGETELDDVSEFEVEWCRQLSDEVDSYLAADEQYQKLMRQAERDADNTDILLVRAAHVLQTALEEATLPIVKEQFQQQLADHKVTAAVISRNARDRADLIGQPSPLWQAQDLNGHRHSLKDYKGKVVVLDFWNRGCGWCMRTIPQVKQVAEQFLGRQVVVLGMNTDRDEKDARLVIAKLKLSYPILKAGALPAKYMIPGFPTLLVIDQQGVVRDMYVGYSPTLGKDVSATIEALLNEKAGR